MKLKDGIFFCAISVAGVAVVTTAPHFTGARLDYDGFLPWMRPGIEDFSYLSAAGLFTVGLIAGFIHPKKPFLTGLATMALFPVWATIEMTLDPKTHNLWPIEFVMYFMYTLIPTTGAFLAGKICSIGKSKGE